jgi:hypothetical protein
MNLDKHPEVNNRGDLAELISLLREDLHNNPDDWENHTLDHFLEAMEAYTRGVDKYYKFNKIPVDADAASPQWQVFADILLGARIYE